MPPEETYEERYEGTSYLVGVLKSISKTIQPLAVIHMHSEFRAPLQKLLTLIVASAAHDVMQLSVVPLDEQLSKAKQLLEANGFEIALPNEYDTTEAEKNEEEENEEEEKKPKENEEEEKKPKENEEEEKKPKENEEEEKKPKENEEEEPKEKPE